MRLLYFAFAFFAARCSEHETNKSHFKIDTAKLFDPNPKVNDESFGKINMFNHCIVLTNPGYYAKLGDSISQMTSQKEAETFFEENKRQITTGKFYILTDSSTAFEKTFSVIEMLKKSGVQDYKVINIQAYFTPPEPIEIQKPTPQLIDSSKISDFSNFIIIVAKEIKVNFQNRQKIFTSISQLDTFISRNKSDINGDNLLIESKGRSSFDKLEPILEILSKHGITKYHLISR